MCMNTSLEQPIQMSFQTLTMMIIMYFLKEKMINKYIITFMNGNLSATKAKTEMMSSIPEPQELIRKKKYLN